MVRDMSLCALSAPRYAGTLNVNSGVPASMRTICVSRSQDAKRYLRQVSAHAALMQTCVHTKKGDDLMQSMIDFICNGATEFTPELVVSLLVFVLTLEAICSMAYSAFSVGRRR